jgi:hypothetical protein
MTGKRYSDENSLNILRQAKLKLASNEPSLENEKRQQAAAIYSDRF